MRNPEKFGSKDRAAPKESEEKEREKIQDLESFLKNNFKKKDIKEIKDFFKEGLDYFRDLRIEKSSEIDKNAFIPGENKLELKEAEVDEAVLKHELHHALIENKYNISGIEQSFFKKFDISKEDISKINKSANKEFSKRFDEAYDLFNDRGKEIIESNMEKRLAKKGMDKDEVRFAVDYYQTQKLLETQKEYRDFILLNIEKEFGKEAANIQEALFDIEGADEIIGHTLSNTHFSLDLIEYKFIDVKNGSKDVFKLRKKIKDEGYFPVIEELIGKKAGTVKDKLGEKTEEELKKAQEKAEEAFEEGEKE